VTEWTNQNAVTPRIPATSQVIAPSRRDEILGSFLERQFEQIQDLAAHSDVVEILRHGPPPPDRYILRFHCKGLVRTAEGIGQADHFDFGIHFPPDYLRRIEVAEVITMLWPPEIFHPNCRFPFICVGRMRPGTGIRDIAYQLYEMMTYNRVVMREDDALDHAACAWARQNQDRFPLEVRPLRRRDLTLRVRHAAAGDGVAEPDPLAALPADDPEGGGHDDDR
jgi:hypothetical protein